MNVLKRLHRWLSVHQFALCRGDIKILFRSSNAGHIKVFELVVSVYHQLAYRLCAIR
jgi:hypothetical protein